MKVLKFKGIPFETAIIEHYRRRESSVEEALIEMYLAGVSVLPVVWKTSLKLYWERKYLPEQ